MESIDTYAEKIRAEVEERLGDGCSVMIQKVTKNNGIVLTGLTVKKDDEAVAPTIYLDGFYEDGSEDAADEIVGIYEKAPSFPGDAGSISRFDDVSGRICYKLVNTAKNEDMLKGMPHRDYMDLSAVYFISLEMGGQMGSVAVTDAIAGMWGKTEQELWDLAFENTQRLFPARIKKLSEVIGSLMGTDEADLPLDAPMYVATNEKCLNGAGVIFYDDILTQLTDRLGETIYILPSSVHEVIAIPDHGTPETEILAGMVKEINRTTVDPKEVLSDSVYRYERGGSIEVAGGGE